LLFNDKAIVARNLRGCNGLDLTCGVRYNNSRKGAATSGWPDQNGDLGKPKNRHFAEWRFLLFVVYFQVGKAQKKESSKMNGKLFLHQHRLGDVFLHL